MNDLPPHNTNIEKCLLCGKNKQFGDSGKKVHLFRFPQDVDRCRAWVRAIGIRSLLFMPIDKLRRQVLCSDHFDPQCVNEKFKRLHKVALPKTSFSSLPHKVVNDFPRKQTAPVMYNLRDIEQPSTETNVAPTILNGEPVIDFGRPLMNSLETLIHNERHTVTKPAGTWYNTISVPLMSYSSSLENGNVFAADYPGNTFKMPLPMIEPVNRDTNSSASFGSRKPNSEHRGASTANEVFKKPLGAVKPTLKAVNKAYKMPKLTGTNVSFGLQTLIKANPRKANQNSNVNAFGGMLNPSTGTTESRYQGIRQYTNNRLTIHRNIPLVTINPATTAPVQQATTAPVQQATAAPFQPATAAPVQQATAALFQPATAAAFQPATAAPFQPATAAPFQPATAAPFQPATAAPFQPATAAPFQPATAAAFQPTTAAVFQPPTAAPFQPATAASVQPATAAPVQPATATSVQLFRAAPAQPATAAPVQPTTVAPVQLFTAGQVQLFTATVPQTGATAMPEVPDFDFTTTAIRSKDDVKKQYTEFFTSKTLYVPSGLIKSKDGTLIQIFKPMSSAATTQQGLQNSYNTDVFTTQSDPDVSFVSYTTPVQNCEQQQPQAAASLMNAITYDSPPTITSNEASLGSPGPTETEVVFSPYTQYEGTISPDSINAHTGEGTEEYGLPLMNCVGTVFQGNIQYTDKIEEESDTIDVPLMCCLKTLENSNIP